VLAEQPRVALVLALALWSTAAAAKNLDDEIVPDSTLNSYGEVGSGLNLGLIHVVLSHGRIWGELSTVVGVPLATINGEGPEMTGVLAVGYGLPFSEHDGGRWYFDLFVEGVFGRLRQFGTDGLLGGGGFGFGFRYLLPSGWSLGMRMPCFGMVVESYNGLHPFRAPDSMADFFIANVYGWSVFTVGYRF
jgi:hypothetical protein